MLPRRIDQISRMPRQFRHDRPRSDQNHAIKHRINRPPSRSPSTTHPEPHNPLPARILRLPSHHHRPSPPPRRNTIHQLMPQPATSCPIARGMLRNPITTSTTQHHINPMPQIPRLPRPHPLITSPTPNDRTRINHPLPLNPHRLMTFPIVSTPHDHHNHPQEREKEDGRGLPLGWFGDKNPCRCGFGVGWWSLGWFLLCCGEAFVDDVGVSW